MIDFRYHLVSIVSIFIALAVGIVLGAGPLQQEIGKTLTTQVETLRKDKADLRAQLDQLQKRTDSSDEFATTVTPSLVGSRLGGRTVALVLLPGADAAAVTELAKVLKASGATVSAEVKLEKGWTDPGKRTARDDLVSTLGPAVGAAEDASAPAEQRMAELLAKGLVVAQVSESLRPSPSAAQALSGLKDAGMISVDGKAAAPATLAVVVAGAPATDGTADERSAQLAAWRALAVSLDSHSSGALVAGPPESAGTGGMVEDVRSDEAAHDTVSTVDDLGVPMGRVAAVFALREQMNGRVGQYGVGSGASAVLPPLPGTS